MIICDSAAELFEKQDKNILQFLEEIGRVCYNSEGRMTDHSHITFIKMLLKNCHLSILEHFRIAFFAEIPYFKYFKKPDNAYIFPEKYIIRNNGIFSINLRTLYELYLYKREDEEVQNLIETTVFFYPELALIFNVPTQKYYELVDVDNLTGDDKDLFTFKTFKLQTSCVIADELVRHRDASYTRSSTRYINFKEGIPIVGNEVCENNKKCVEVLDSIHEVYKELIAESSIQMARDILPNNLRAITYVTANLAEWTNIFNLRLADNAHPEMIKIMQKVRALMV